MFDLEIKNINEDFSVYKYSAENNVKYGLCIQSELEDLKNVSGIGDVRFSNISDYITVKSQK